MACMREGSLGASLSLLKSETYFGQRERVNLLVINYLLTFLSLLTKVRILKETIHKFV